LGPDSNREEVEGDVLKCLRLDIQPRRTRIWTRSLTVPNRVASVSSTVSPDPQAPNWTQMAPPWCPDETCNSRRVPGMRDPSVIRQAAQDHADLRWLSETATRVSPSGPPPGEHQDR